MDIFDLQATITLNADEYINQLKKAKSTGEKLIDNVKDVGESSENAEKKVSKLGTALKNGLAAAAKVSAAALGAAVTGLVKLTTSAVENFAEYEQLAGGVETLFKGASDTVMQNAQNAYKTIGISANQYMEQATSVAAALINSTQKTTEAVGAVTEATIEGYENQYEAVKSSQEKQVDALEKSQDKQLEKVEKSQEKKLEKLEASHEKELERFEKLTDKKIALINKQYEENLKIVDKEEYDRLQAVQAQIDALNAEQDAEDEAAKIKEQNQKKAALQEKINSAETADARREAQEALNEYLEKLEADHRKEQRKAQIEDLKEQQSVIKDESAAKKEALKTEYDEQIAAVKEESEAKLKELKKGQKKELEALKDSQKEQLSTLKENQRLELEALKDSNSQKLAEMKSFIAEQKKLVADDTTTVAKGSKDYQAAAELADIALSDMADNVSKMGTTMESIQNAYSGFAKQNYTMLDNLKLGYGGTKEEMEKLLADAQAISGVEYDISSYGDIVKAIHEIQKEMGITGNAAAEASTTISGSVGSMKAAWENLVVGLADNKADLGALITAFSEAAITAGGNIAPVISKTVAGIGQLITGLIPIIVEELPNVMNDTLPQLLEAAVTLIETLGAGINENLEPLIETLMNVVLQLVDVIVENAPSFLQAALTIIETLGAGLIEYLPTLLPTLVEIILEIVEMLLDNVDMIIDVSIQLLTALADGIINSLLIILEQAPVIISKLAKALIEAAPDLLIAVAEIGMKIYEACLELTPLVWEAIADCLYEITVAIGEGFVDWFNKFEDFGGKIYDWVEGIKETLKERIGKAIETAKEVIFETDWLQVGKDILGKLGEGISNGWKTVKNTIGGFFGGIFGDNDEDDMYNFETTTPENPSNSNRKSTVVYQTNNFGGKNSLADQEKANERLAAAFA